MHSGRNYPKGITEPYHLTTFASTNDNKIKVDYKRWLNN